MLRAAIAAGALAHKAFVCCDAVIRSAVRSIFTHRHLLSWTTAAQSDAASGKRLLPALFFPVSVFFVLFAAGGTAQRLYSVLILLYIPLALSDGIAIKTHFQKPVSQTERQSLFSFASAAWRYFEENVTAEENFLPPDNVQETPVPRKAHRTSPTNIGLYMASVLAAADMALISPGDMRERLDNTLDSLERLPKYKGLLYNWYDTKKADILHPAYISSVDCGNFLVCLTALGEGLKEYFVAQPLLRQTKKRIDGILSSSDLTPLYDKKRNLFRIGLDPQNGEPSPSFYDLYMSEARMTSYYASARRIVPFKHWLSLDRTVKKSGRYAAAASWTDRKSVV